MQPSTPSTNGDARIDNDSTKNLVRSHDGEADCDHGPVVEVRPTRIGEEPALREIEVLAGEQFRDVGMGEVADDEPVAVETLAAYAADGRSWTVVDSDDVPLGYLLVDVVDGCAHVEQLSVRPERQGQGLGRALVDHIREWASERHLSAITLTTFADVPWNAPLYRHLGFRDLREDEIGPELRAVRALEAAHGLDPATRICMRAEIEVGP